MKRLLIPILSLSFIISLDSCKKDSDPQPEEPVVADTTRVVKTSYNHSTSSTTETTFFEYDKSGRIIALKDSADPGYIVTISYNGDEVTVQDPPASQGNYNYVAHYKLNGNRLPVQRITVEGMDAMTATYPRFEIHTDTCKYEYDAAGLLVKATGKGYDSSWSKNQASPYIRATRKAYSTNYINKDGKLMSVKTLGAEETTQTIGANTYTGAMNTEENYSFEYTKNYLNKSDSINAWLFVELDLLYSSKFPMIKYANLPDKMNHTTKSIDPATGDVYNNSDETNNVELEYLPSGYISSIKFIDGNFWDRTRITYNK